MFNKTWLLILTVVAILVYLYYPKNTPVDSFNGSTNGNENGIFAHTPYRFPVFISYPLGTDPEVALETSGRKYIASDETGIPMDEYAEIYNSETFLKDEDCQPGTLGKNNTESIDNQLAKGIVTRVPPTGGAAIDGGLGGMRGGPVAYNDNAILI